MDRQPADVVRTCFSVGFWLLAAGASAVLGLDLELDDRPCQGLSAPKVPQGVGWSRRGLAGCAAWASCWSYSSPSWSSLS